MKTTLMILTMLLSGVLSSSVLAGNGVCDAKPAVVLYESSFDVEGTAVNNYYRANAKSCNIDGAEWKMTFACLTAQYVFPGKSSHILASIRKETTDKAVVESGNLLKDNNTVTSFMLKMSSRNKALTGCFCKVEYTVDGTNWISTGEDFEPMKGATSAADYTFEVKEGETGVFQVRVTFHLNGESYPVHAFFNLEGIKVMGY